MQIPEPIPAEGIKIPLKFSFSGIKNVPLLSFSSNSINPKLLLFDDATETRVLKTNRRPISEIETIDVSYILGKLYLTVSWKKRWFDFTGCVESEETLLDIVRFFQRKGIALGDGARRFIGEPAKE